MTQNILEKVSRSCHQRKVFSSQRQLHRQQQPAEPRRQQVQHIQLVVAERQRQTPE